MDAFQLSSLADVMRPGSRRAAVTLAAGALATFLGPAERESAARKRKRKKKKRASSNNVCAGKNWCLDRSQTCGPEGGYGKCLIEAFGGNICAEILFQAATCADCEPSACTDCVCVLAAGGGDRCNNGASGYDYICARPV